jgi:hypothetical protein
MIQPKLTGFVMLTTFNNRMKSTVFQQKAC